LIFVISLAVLIKSSDVFVDSAEKIGLALGVSPFIIGVTIVAFGTSLPELATSIASVQLGSSEIVIANVVGSNITNILLVVGVVAVVGKGIDLNYNIMNIDMPMLIASSILMWFTISDGSLNLFEVSLFLIALIVFLTHSIKKKRVKDDNQPALNPMSFLLLVIGGLLIYFSAEYVIQGLKGIAKIGNVDEAIISSGALALGTSLPELVVSLAAVKRNNHSIAIGNVVGSNIFNTYGVLGVASLFGNLVFPESILTFSAPFMIAITMMFAFVMLTKKVSRWEGYMLLIFYSYYIYNLTQLGIN